MKEHIYTIPLNEALDKQTECPLCEIKSNLEKAAVDYVTGAAMMEPDVRVQTNELGFCATHLSQMILKPNKLSLALLLDTRLEMVRTQIASPTRKRGLFKKVDIPFETTCFVCKRLDEQMKSCIDNFAFLLKQPEFFQRVIDSRGFCVEHYMKLVSLCDEKCSVALFELMQRELMRINEEVHLFVKKFDYKNDHLPWENSKTAVKRACEKFGMIE